jgi:polar amino acid transport system permease protein
VIGLGIHYGTYCSEAYRAGIESVPKGQWEAATALNLSTPTTWRSVILPQAIPTAIPALGNYFVAMFKDAPLGFAITFTGIMAAAGRISSNSFQPLEAYTMTGLLFLAVSIPAALFARILERRYGYQR